MNECASTEVNNNKYIDYQRTFSFLYAKNIDGVGSILFSMKDFKPKQVKKSYEEFSEYVVLTCLDALKISKENGWDKFRVYVNLNNCSMENFSLKIFKHINNLTANAFPETLETCFVCSTTKLFKILWGLVYKIIDKDTRPKFKLVDDFSHLFELYKLN